MKGLVFDIQHFSIHDGPGIRTTVFMKGCTLDCQWCHNPESIKISKEIQTYFFKCIGCGRCFELCPNGAHSIYDGKRVYNRAVCQKCGTCTDNCYSGALVMSGEEKTIEQVVEDIARDINFYRDSGGGVTFSGGEPLLQSDFVAEALKSCKERGIHTAIDTAGNIPYEAFEKVMPFTDMFLYDLKTMDAYDHKHYTGAGNKLILENLEKLSKTGKPIRIRIPVIPEVNDSIENMEDTINFLLSLDNIEAIEPLAYHSLGAGKLESMGQEDGKVFSVPDREKILEIYNFFEEKGYKVIRKPIYKA
ncbi:MAG: glycyl-radical enzyme activating protein [Clostridia bacterium]|nr:glycyl-radical enzyme activating protein [Clostridia bacterium]